MDALGVLWTLLGRGAFESVARDRLGMGLMDARLSVPASTLALEWLREVFPRVFKYHDKPLKRGVHKDVMAADPPFSPAVIRLALYRHTHHYRYLAAVAAKDEAGRPAGWRHDLRGRVTSKITKAASHAARAELQRRRQDQQRRRALAAERSDRLQTPTYDNSRTPGSMPFRRVSASGRRGSL